VDRADGSFASALRVAREATDRAAFLRLAVFVVEGFWRDPFVAAGFGDLFAAARLAGRRAEAAFFADAFGRALPLALARFAGARFAAVFRPRPPFFATDLAACLPARFATYPPG
jgi:hypothetical protein